MHALLRSILLLAVVGSSIAAPQKTEIPKAAWEPIFFESINSLSRKVGWTPLRQVDIPTDSIEVRVWVGFGSSRLAGVQIRRVGQKWSGFFVRDGRGEKWPLEVRELTPRVEWNAVWKKLEALGILTLADSSSLPDEQMVHDGVSYVVEINDGIHYRTYQYGNPQEQKWPEAKKIIEIVNILYSDLVQKNKTA